MSRQKTMYIFAGPNGSGKSTIISGWCERNDEVFYVCADEIVKTAALCGIQDEKERNWQAMQKAEEYVERLIQKGDSFAYETVLSSQYKWRLIQLAKQNGYRIESYFVTTSDPKINVARVQRRVAANGHPVPEDKVIERYHKSMMNLGQLIEMSDKTFVFDNSIDSDTMGAVRLVLYKTIDGIYSVRECPWLEILIQSWEEEKKVHSSILRDYSEAALELIAGLRKPITFSVWRKQQQRSQPYENVVQNDKRQK